MRRGRNRHPPAASLTHLVRSAGSKVRKPKARMKPEDLPGILWDTFRKSPADASLETMPEQGNNDANV